MFPRGSLASVTDPALNTPMRLVYSAWCGMTIYSSTRVGSGQMPGDTPAPQRNVQHLRGSRYGRSDGAAHLSGFITCYSAGGSAGSRAHVWHARELCGPHLCWGRPCLWALLSWQRDCTAGLGPTLSGWALPGVTLNPLSSAGSRPYTEHYTLAFIKNRKTVISSEGK